MNNKTIDIDFLIRHYGYIYLIINVCVAGVALSLTSIIVFARLSGSLYKYYLAKSVTELLILLIGVFISSAKITENNTNNSSSSFLFIFGKKFFQNYLIYAAQAFTSLLDLLITYDRLISLENRNSVISSKWKKSIRNYSSNLAVFSVISLGVFTPYLFTTSMHKLAEQQSEYEAAFQLVPTDFAESTFCRFFLISVTTVKPASLLVLFFVLNVFILRRVRRPDAEAAERNELIRESSSSSCALRPAHARQEMRLTKTVLALNTNVLISGLIWLVSSSILTMNSNAQSRSTGFLDRTTRAFCEFVSMLSTFSSYPLNWLIYVVCNRRFRHVMCKILKFRRLGFVSDRN